MHKKPIWIKPTIPKGKQYDWLKTNQAIDKKK